MKELNAFRKFLAEGNAHDEVLSPLMTSDKTNLQEPIEQVLKTRDYIQVNKISGDYLAQVYNFDDYKNLNITPDDVKSALHKLDVVKITDGDKLASDYDLGGLGEYVLIDYNGNKYLAHDGGRYITALAEGKEENVSENTSMNDIEIMGQTFNFSDICPSAHKLVQNQAIVHHGHSNTAPTVLKFAVLHRNFFNLERKALGSQGITVDEFNNEVKPLYDKILDVAADLMVRKSAKEYMDMHMAKIKDAGFKASEPGGSSDRNFEEGYEPTDKELDFADEIEYEQDWRDEQDAMFGKPMGKLEEKLEEVRNRLGDVIEGYTDLHKNDVVLESFLGESNAERNPLRGIKNMFQAIIPLKLDTSTLGSLGYAKAAGIDGDWNAIQFFTEHPEKYEKYKDLLKQANGFGVDVNPSTNVLNAYNAIAAAANEYELREELDERQKYADDQLKFKKGDTVYFKNLKGAAKYPMTITGPGKFRKTNKLDAGGKEIVFPVKGGPRGKGMYAADELVKDPKDIRTDFAVSQADKIPSSAVKNLEEGPVQTFTSGLDKYQSYPHVYVFKVRTMSTDKQGDKFVYNHTYEVKDGLDWNGVLAQVDQLIALPETIGVGVDIYYTTGQKEGQLGGQAEVVRWSHDAVYKAPKSDYILNARKNQFEDEEAERIMAIRNFMNSSLMGRPPQNVDNQAEKLYPAIKRMKDEVKNILANK